MSSNILHFSVEFSFVILECRVLVVLLNSVSESSKSLFFQQNLLIYLFRSHYQKLSVFFFFLTFQPNISSHVFRLTHFCLLSWFLYLSFELNKENICQEFSKQFKATKRSIIFNSFFFFFFLVPHASASCFSLMFKWQQASSGLEDLSQYSVRSKKYRS